MQTLTTTSPRARPAPADSALPTRLVAVEALLLRPLDRAGPVTTIVDRGPWPVFVIVLDDPAIVDPGARPLFDLLDSPHRNRISIGEQPLPLVGGPRGRTAHARRPRP